MQMWRQLCLRLGWGWEPRGTWTGPVCRPGAHGQSLPGQLWAREVADIGTFGQGKSGPAAHRSRRKLCTCAPRSRLWDQGRIFT